MHLGTADGNGTRASGSNTLLRSEKNLKNATNWWALWPGTLQILICQLACSSRSGCFLIDASFLLLPLSYFTPANCSCPLPHVRCPLSVCPGTPVRRLVAFRIQNVMLSIAWTSVRSLCAAYVRSVDEHKLRLSRSAKRRGAFIKCATVFCPFMYSTPLSTIHSNRRELDDIELFVAGCRSGSTLGIGIENENESDVNDAGCVCFN